MATYLVTGVAGFIGAAVAKALLDQGHRVIGVDNLTTGYTENIPVGTEFYEADCQDARLYAEHLPKLSYAAIFHIAGQSSGEISFDDPVYDLRTNAESTLHLLKFALAVGCKRFIYASTMSVYGIKPDMPIREDSPPVPQSFYGVGKLASEHYLRIYEQYGIRSTALRLFNVYGPGQNMANLRQGMVSIFMAMMLDSNQVQVKGSPDRYRDFVYIDDVVRAFLLCLDNPESAGQVINIAGSGKKTVAELLKTMAALHTPRHGPPHIHFSGSTPGDLMGIAADISLAEKILGYKPTVSFADGLSRMYNWAIGEGEKASTGQP
jgi:UDP-glucose 4-epimerase